MNPELLATRARPAPETKAESRKSGKELRGLVEDKSKRVTTTTQARGPSWDEGGGMRRSRLVRDGWLKDKWKSPRWDA